MPPAASHPHAPGAPGLSLVPDSTPEFWNSVRSLVACAPGLTVSVCCLPGAVREYPRSPVQVATTSQCPNAAAPPPSVYLLISVRGFRAPRFVPQYSALEMFISRDPDVSSCISGSFHGCSGCSGTYLARISGLAEKGVPYTSAILTPPWVALFSTS